MRSLKTRLIVWVASSAIVLTAGAGVSLYVLAREHLVGQFDASLVHKARLLSSTIRMDYQALDMEFEDLDMSEFESSEAGGYFQVWFEGESIYRSPSLGGADLTTEGAGGDPSILRWVDLPEGRGGRAIVYRFEPEVEVESEADGEGAVDGGVEVTLCLARDVEEITEAMGALKYGLAGVGVVLAAVMSVVIGYGVNRGLRPVRTLTTQLSELDERTLGRRIDLPGMPEELQPIVEQFNGLMERLGEAFERERSFSAAIAHELRTPLAGLLTTIEVARAKPRSGEEYGEYLQQLLGVVTQTRVMVESLLQLGALENGQAGAGRQSVRLNQAIEQAWEDVTSDGAARKRFELRRSLDADVTIVTDAGLLAVVLRNVLGNAVTYVNDGGVISIATAVRGGVVEIRVSNTGSRVAAEDANKVFDRFWRADKARAQTGERFGLGLSIVNLAVMAIGGTVRAESTDGGEFAIVVRLSMRGS